MSKEKFEAAQRGLEAVYVDRIAERWMDLFKFKADEVQTNAYKAAGGNDLEKVIECGAEMAVLAKLVETCSEMRKEAIKEGNAQAEIIANMIK